MIKRLAGSIREFKKPTLLTPLLMILEVAMECLIPMIMSKLLDYGINEQNMQQIFFINPKATLFWRNKFLMEN